MKRLSIKSADRKINLLARTGLFLIFVLSCPVQAPAQATAPMPTAPLTPVASGTPVPAGMPPGTPVPVATPTTPSTAASATQPGSGSAAVPVSTTTPPVSPVAQETLPAASKSDAPQPSAAELAIVQNAATLNSLTPVPPAVSGGPKGEGLKVTDILATPANIRPLPEQYLVVKKDHPANDAEAHLMAARAALWQGHYQAALELFDDLYKKNTHDIRISMGRAVSLQKLGQLDEAMDAYQAALSTDPRNIEALTNMLGLLRGQDTATAAKKLQELRDMYPANPDVTAQLGMVYGMAGDYEKAVKYLDMADALKPGSAVVLYNKAVAYDHMGKTAEAADLYRQIVLLASDGSLDQGFPIEAVRQRLATIR